MPSPQEQIHRLEEQLANIKRQNEIMQSATSTAKARAHEARMKGLTEGLKAIEDLFVFAPLVKKLGGKIAPLTDDLVDYLTDKQASMVFRLMDEHEFTREEAIHLVSGIKLTNVSELSQTITNALQTINENKAEK